MTMYMYTNIYLTLREAILAHSEILVLKVNIKKSNSQSSKLFSFFLLLGFSINNDVLE